MTNQGYTANEIVWRPAPQMMFDSHLLAFMTAHGIGDLAELQQRSIDDPQWFWSAVLDDLGIQFFTPYTQVMDTSEGLPWTRWCVDGRMNIVHNCLDKRIGTPHERRDAIRWSDENGAVRVLTYGDLSRLVNRAANALKRLGFRRGDVIGICMPMVPEIAIAFFAIMKIGGIVMPLFSGYGAEALATRLNDAGARGLFTADGFQRKGRRVAMKTVVDEALDRVTSITRVVVLKRTGDPISMRGERDVWWHDIIERESSDCEAEQTGADDPCLLIYTSGTTGRPKGAVHSHCGFPVKAAQDMRHGFDVGESDALFWISDLGWMMGPWALLGTTVIGGTIVMNEGAVDYPSCDRLWQIVEQHRVSVLGVSPTLVRLFMRAKPDGPAGRDLSSLRILGSTGEPWNPDPWLWWFDTVGRRRLPIINYSGGTEISGAIVSGNVLTPMKPCAFSGPLPGMAADVVDDLGRSVRGSVGELVIRAPWIGMARGFWNDRERYLQTYWSKYPDVWVHGDWSLIDDDGFWYILGRSDDTLKLAGKRVGPAEIESALVSHPLVVEAAAIGVPDEVKGEALVCFCVLNHDAPDARTNDDALKEELKEHVARAMGRALRPSDIVFVKELPKTRNGKIMRRVIRASYLGEDPGDVSALDS